MNWPDTLLVREWLAIAKDSRRVNDRINMPGLVSQSANDLVEDENDPDGEFDSLN